MNTMQLMMYLFQDSHLCWILPLFLLVHRTVPYKLQLKHFVQLWVSKNVGNIHGLLNGTRWDFYKNLRKCATTTTKSQHKWHRAEARTLCAMLLCLVGNPVPNLRRWSDQSTNSIWNLANRMFPASKPWFKSTHFYFKSSSRLQNSRLLPSPVCSFRSVMSVALGEDAHQRQRESRGLPIYPWVAPAPGAAAVSPCEEESGSERLFPIKTTIWRVLRCRRERALTTPRTVSQSAPALSHLNTINRGPIRGQRTVPSTSFLLVTDAFVRYLELRVHQPEFVRVARATVLRKSSFTHAFSRSGAERGVGWSFCHSSEEGADHEEVQKTLGRHVHRPLRCLTMTVRHRFTQVRPGVCNHEWTNRDISIILASNKTQIKSQSKPQTHFHKRCSDDHSSFTAVSQKTK